MKERPILFSGEMVRAILDGRKTVTRRVVKPQPELRDRRRGDGPGGWHFKTAGLELNNWTDAGKFAVELAKACPYGQPGDRLWVRHAWWEYESTPANPANYQIWDEFTKTVRWKTGERIENCKPVLDHNWKKKPSIFMPRWASRITLEVTGVRMERVQEITSDAIYDEGTPGAWTEWGTGWEKHTCLPACRGAFQTLWDSLNAKRGFGWEKNPWVWVVEFRRVAQ